MDCAGQDHTVPASARNAKVRCCIISKLPIDLINRGFRPLLCIVMAGLDKWRTWRKVWPVSPEILSRIKISDETYSLWGNILPWRGMKSTDPKILDIPEVTECCAKHKFKLHEEGSGSRKFGRICPLRHVCTHVRQSLQFWRWSCLLAWLQKSSAQDLYNPRSNFQDEQWSFRIFAGYKIIETEVIGFTTFPSGRPPINAKGRVPTLLPLITGSIDRPIPLAIFFFFFGFGGARGEGGSVTSPPP